MAIPIANAGAAQTFAYAALPQVVALDGSASSDPDGDPITAYLWTWLDKPTGSAAVLDDAASATPTFTADLPGTYLLLLRVTAGGEDSDTDALTAPDAAYARVSVTTEHRALYLPADGERYYGDRTVPNFEALDALAGAYDAHVANQTAHWPKASAAAFGTSKLSSAPTDPATPIALSPTEPSYQTLINGSNADALHTHVLTAADGRHHVLRHDLLVGTNDRTWTAGQIAALTRSQNAGGTRDAWAGADGDGVLQVDVEKEDSNLLAGVIWPAPAGDIEAICDLRLSFDGPLLAQDVNQYLTAGFGWMPDATLGTPSRLLAAGIALRDWGFRAADLGASDSANGGAVTDWNGVAADSTALTPLVRTGLLITELLVRFRRFGTAAWSEVSVGGGGFVRLCTWSSVPTAAGKFTLFGALKRSDAGLRIKSTGCRIRTPDTWFGA